MISISVELWYGGTSVGLPHLQAVINLPEFKSRRLDNTIRPVKELSLDAIKTFCNEWRGYASRNGLAFEMKPDVMQHINAKGTYTIKEKARAFDLLMSGGFNGKLRYIRKMYGQEQQPAIEFWAVSPIFGELVLCAAQDALDAATDKD